MPIKKPPDLPNLDMTDPQLGVRDANFNLSDSGTFSKDDFTLKAHGITQSPFGHRQGSSILDQLQFVRKLGVGNSSEVKLMRHTPSNQLVALKQLKVIQDANLREQVINELKVLCAVRCDHLVALFDAFYRDGTIHLALEYMDAGSLEDVCKRAGRRMPPAALGQVLLQVLQGLIYLHRETHHLHRDLKPANVLLSAQGAVKLADFGISRQLENTAALAATFCGTARYMAPERLTGEGYSWASDVWCVGLIALECATGTHPYPHVDERDLFKLHIAILQDEEPTSAPGLAQELERLGFPPDFLSFCAACTQKDPARRPSALQLIEHPYMQRVMANPQGTHDLAGWLHSLGLTGGSLAGD